jgi:hypothetical protein
MHRSTVLRCSSVARSKGGDGDHRPDAALRRCSRIAREEYGDAQAGHDVGEGGRVTGLSGGEAMDDGRWVLIR